MSGLASFTAMMEVTDFCGPASGLLRPSCATWLYFRAEHHEPDGHAGDLVPHAPTAEHSRTSLTFVTVTALPMMLAGVIALLLYRPVTC